MIFCGAKEIKLKQNYCGAFENSAPSDGIEVEWEMPTFVYVLSFVTLKWTGHMEF